MQCANMYDKRVIIMRKRETSAHIRALVSTWHMFQQLQDLLQACLGRQVLLHIATCTIEIIHQLNSNIHKHSGYYYGLNRYLTSISINRQRSTYSMPQTSKALVCTLHPDIIYLKVNTFQDQWSAPSYWCSILLQAQFLWSSSSTSLLVS